MTITSQLTEDGKTLHLLTRAFSNFSCPKMCALSKSIAKTLGVQLNYFRCYMFEGGNDDDVTNAGTTPDVVCKSTLLSVLLS